MINKLKNYLSISTETQVRVEHGQLLAYIKEDIDKSLGISCILRTETSCMGAVTDIYTPGDVTHIVTVGSDGYYGLTLKISDEDLLLDLDISETLKYIGNYTGTFSIIKIGIVCEVESVVDSYEHIHAQIAKSISKYDKVIYEQKQMFDDHAEFVRYVKAISDIDPTTNPDLYYDIVYTKDEKRYITTYKHSEGFSETLY